MFLPRPKIGTPLLVCCQLWAMFGAPPVAASVEIRPGNLLVADRTADPLDAREPRGAVMLIDPAGAVVMRVLASPNGFVDPVGTLPLGDGTLLCVDQNAEVIGDGRARGAIWRIDPRLPLPGRADLFAAHHDWFNPVDILEEPTGNFLLLDADADPLVTGIRPGALYRVNRTTRAVTLVAASQIWREPSSIVYDIDGSVLMWDRHADPNESGGSPGALFRINPLNGNVTTVFSLNAFTSPTAVALDREGDFLIVDRDANPNGHPGQPGGVFRVRRADLFVQPIIFPRSFVEPTDIAVDAAGHVWVVDENANPHGYPTARGALFRCDPATGQIRQTIASSFFRNLNGLSRFAGTALDSSRVSWHDLSGPPLQAGERMRVRIRPRNTGSSPIRPVIVEHTLGAAWDYIAGSDSVSAGAYTFDPLLKKIRWQGDVEVQGEPSISYEIRLKDTVPAGTVLRERPTIGDGRTTLGFPLEAVVATRSRPGRHVWADYQPADPVTRGMLLEMPAGAFVPSRIFQGPPLVHPDDLAFLEDGRIAVMDRRSRPRGPIEPPGGIYRVDPYLGTIDTLMAFADHPELLLPLGLAAGRPGELLIVDKDANPRGLPGLPGAVFGYEIATKVLTLIASDPRFREPADAILESTGKILMVDYDADPLGNNPRGGGVFEIDRRNGSIHPLPVPAGTYVDPIGIAEGNGRRVYVADLSADPTGIGGNTGAIFQINRGQGDAVTLFSAGRSYVDPTDLFPMADGSVIVTDRDANPLDLPPRDRGAVFRVLAGGGEPSIVAADPMMYGPEAIAGVVAPSIGHARLTATDANGSPTLPGDTLRFEATIRNTGRVGLGEALATISLSRDLTILDAEGPGTVSVDPAANSVAWVGSVPLGDTIQVRARVRVAGGLRFGQRVFGLLRLSAPGAPAPDSAVVKVVAELGSGDMVLVDLNADPMNLGQADGALFVLNTPAGKSEGTLFTHPIWLDPSAVELHGPGRVLVADTRGNDSGAIYRLDYMRGTMEIHSADERLGAPTDLLWTQSGDLLIVDPFSRVIPQGPFSPAVFVQRGGEGDLDVLCSAPALLTPSQIVEDEQGRLWLVDRRADPNGESPGRGAIFRIDPETGSLVDTLQFPSFSAPVGMVAWPGKGLLVVDEVARIPGGGTGAVFLVDPDQRSSQVAVADPRFRMPRSAAFTPSEELWIVDRMARDQGLPGSPRTLFRWDPATGRVTLVGQSALYTTPADLVAYPGPNPRLVEYAFEDLNGPPLEAGDELVFRARVANVGPIATLNAAYRDTLPSIVRFDDTSVTADAGIVEFRPGMNGPTWKIDLPPGASHEIQYRGRVHAGAGQGTTISFRAHLNTAEGVHRVRRLSDMIPVYLEDGHLYVADDDADPFGLGNRPGAVYKVALSNGRTITLGSTSVLVTPVHVLEMPTTDPMVIVVDSDANPRNYRIGRGCLWKWIARTNRFELLAADSTFRSPRVAVPLNDREVLLLDARADPFGLTAAPGPGALYRVDVTTGRVERFFSSTQFSVPVGLVLDGSNGALILDVDADPGRYGLRNGAIYRVDLEARQMSIFAYSADFRGPVAAALGADGMLHVLDRDVEIYPNTASRGAIYQVDPMGNVRFAVSSRSFRRPHAIGVDARGRYIVTDRDADVRGRGLATGAVFRRETPTSDFTALSSFPRFENPSGFFFRDDLTAIEILDLTATPTEQGIQIHWRAPGVTANGFLIQRAEGAHPDPNDYRTLNHEEPTPGRGPWEYLDADVKGGETYSYLLIALLPGGGERSFGPVVATAAASRRFSFYPPAPHPARAETTFRFDLPADGVVGLRIYDLSGRRIRGLVEWRLPAGHHAVHWDGRNDAGRPVASGLYFARLEWSNRAASRRIVFMR